VENRPYKVLFGQEESAPDAEEAISWGMPTFRFHGNLVHFAAYKNHIGFYPGSSAINAFHKGFFV